MTINKGKGNLTLNSRQFKLNPLLMGLATYLSLCVYAPFHQIDVHGEMIPLSKWFDQAIPNANPIYRFMELPNIVAIDFFGKAIGDINAVPDHLKNISTSGENKLGQEFEYGSIEEWVKN